jgi:predicted GNAT family N-acyltransferase
MIEVRVARTAEDVKQCLRLRWTVFVEEQGVRPSDDRDAHDETDAVHVVASLDGVPCGAGRFIFVEPGLAKIQRMAVVDDVRGNGVGKAILAALEAEAAREGARKLTLDAQVRARGFYEKAGYRPSSGEFDDGTGILHLGMVKSI